VFPRIIYDIILISGHISVKQSGQHDVIWIFPENVSCGSSAGIATATGWTAGFRFLERARNFYFLYSIQTISEVHPASYPMRTGVFFPGSKVDGA
jgi:hypothetical protein